MWKLNHIKMSKQKELVLLIGRSAGIPATDAWVPPLAHLQTSVLSYPAIGGLTFTLGAWAVEADKGTTGCLDGVWFTHKAAAVENTEPIVVWLRPDVSFWRLYLGWRVL